MKQVYQWMTEGMYEWMKISQPESKVMNHSLTTTFSCHWILETFSRETTETGLTSRLLSVLNSIRSWSLVKASLEYWKLNVEKGVSGSSKMSKSANSFSFSVSLGTPVGILTSETVSKWVKKSHFHQLNGDEIRVYICDKRYVKLILITEQPHFKVCYFLIGLIDEIFLRWLRIKDTQLLRMKGHKEMEMNSFSSMVPPNWNTNP